MFGSKTAMPDVTCTECGNCGAQAWGHTATELGKDGWTHHDLTGGQKFHVCGDCNREFEVRRLVRNVEVA